MNETVAAVVVTYNRKQLLTECLDALLAQTRPVDKIILIDNASTDGTPELLREHGYLDNPLIDYVRLPENTGGAGGFHEGVKRGYEAGYDWVWLMDDDAEPMLNALEKMSPGFLMDQVLAVANYEVDRKGIYQTTHRGLINLCRSDAKVIRELSVNDVKNNVIDIEHSSFVGVAINRVAIKKIGFPKKEFFIHLDDLEYFCRILSVGKSVMIKDSIIKHKDERISNNYNRKFMWRSSARIPLISLWIDYYGQRNIVWLKRKHCRKPKVFIFIFYIVLRKCASIIMFDDNKLLRIRFYMTAYHDGWTGVFDNTKAKKILLTRK